jgi:hypothetical protein
MRFLSQQLDPVGLDQNVDDESAAGLLLAVEAVTAVDEEGLRRQPVANRATRAAACHARRPSSMI